ncbi:NAD(P)-binding domain [Phytophthora cactorum]|nr:NAD(P)-binding domain [Phytophthora cactorum]
MSAAPRIVTPTPPSLKENRSSHGRTSRVHLAPEIGGWGGVMYPCVVGHEIAGEVTLAGSDVKDLKVGDRVGVGAEVWACLNKDPSEPCSVCASGDDGYCPQRVGTYNYKYKSDGAISSVASRTMCVLLTMFTPLKEAGIKPGDRLGHIAIQFAKALGAASVVAFSRSNSKETEARRLGADEFVNYSDETQAAAATSSFNAFHVVAKGAKFVGSNIGSIQNIKEMLEVASKMNVRPVIQKLPMNRVNEGLQMMRNGSVRYRVVLEN